jgi:hypothetical protein
MKNFPRNQPEINRIPDIVGFRVRAYDEFIKPATIWALINKVVGGQFFQFALPYRKAGGREQPGT